MLHIACIHAFEYAATSSPPLIPNIHELRPFINLRYDTQTKALKAADLDTFCKRFLRSPVERDRHCALDSAMSALAGSTLGSNFFMINVLRIYIYEKQVPTVGLTTVRNDGSAIWELFVRN